LKPTTTMTTMATTASSTTNNYHGGNLVRRLKIYDEDCCSLLEEAYSLAHEEFRSQKQQLQSNRVPVVPSSRSTSTSTLLSPTNPIRQEEDYSSDEDNDVQEDDDESSSSSSEDDGDDDKLATLQEEEEVEQGGNNELRAEEKKKAMTTKPSNTNIKSKKNRSKKHQKRQNDMIQKQSSILQRVGLRLQSSSSDDDYDDEEEEQKKKLLLLLLDNTPISKDERLIIFPPSSLLSRGTLLQSQYEPTKAEVDQTSALMALSQNLSSSSYIVCLLLQSGRFAGGVFLKGKCVAHRTSVHYTVRKGQGKAQSTQDGNRRPKSMGSQLRRAGEQSTKDDIQSTLKEWKYQHPYIDNAALILLSCPKTMRSVVFFNDTDGGDGGSKVVNNNVVLSKDDDRVRKVPFDVGRPTYEQVQVVHDVMTSVDICTVQVSTLDQLLLAKRNDDDEDGGGGVDAAATTPSSISEDADELAAKEQAERLEQLKIDLPLTPLHEAARDGNLEVLLDLLKKMNEEQHQEKNGADHLIINQPAGYDCMTPLHYAAESTSNVDPATAAACVSAILIQGSSADPTRRDARERVPYFLATHDKVREEFRKARAILGEDYCNWDKGAKVGPPLTDDDLNARKEKEAEKKRRKKAKQKEKKAKERSQAQEMEERRKKRRGGTTQG